MQTLDFSLGFAVGPIISEAPLALKHDRGSLMVLISGHTVNLHTSFHHRFSPYLEMISGNLRKKAEYAYRLNFTSHFPKSDYQT